MSSGVSSRHASVSSRSQGSRGSARDVQQQQQQQQQPVSLDHDQHHARQPADVAQAFKPCAATASFFLHAQGTVIFCLHHDTLAVERRFECHHEDVLLIAADNVSDRSAGRLVVSCDASLTAIVWDLFTGDEIARFASYEPIHTAAWMRDGTIAFGNAQGSIILFDPTTSEHHAARTIFDPITAIAPAADCKTFAIGYFNGSILIATLQPFTILHTLNTSRGPSPISGLAWHGSSSKQKTEMLATQTCDGGLYVWSIAKSPLNEQPRIIRILQASDVSTSSKSWFAWSKNGRIVQYTDEETRAWDVRTKRVSHVHIPTISEVTAVTNYGPTATLFTIGPEQSIQQYDLNPSGQPVMVANVQHAPANAPPTPPDSAPRETPPPVEPPTVPQAELSSEDESMPMSPLQKIAQEMEQIEEEMRDRVGPLSPVSSRASSRASMSSASSYGRKNRSRHREKNYTSNRSDHGSEYTAFSNGSSMPQGRESVSIRSMSSATSSRYTPPSRHRPSRHASDPEDRPIELFPYIRARLSEVKFRTPSFGTSKLTPDVLRREMLSVVFGWEEDIEELIQEEMAYHKAGSASRVLLGKWMGEDGTDQMAQMVGSQSMSSSDWMLLAMTSQMGQGAQKQIGETFVRRLLETDEVHPAVAVLLGLDEPNEAVEAYVSRRFFMEAVLLTCLLFPNDWQRQSFLLRKWGETAVASGQAELAVRCFSCTSVDTSEPWFSPRAQEEVYAAQQSLGALASPTSPLSAGPSSRIANKNANLAKLVTSFEKAASKPAANTTVGVTPIIDSALSPGAEKPWKRSHSRGFRDPSSARTATPGGYSRRRGPSADPAPRTALDADATPLVGAHSRPNSRLSNKEPSTAVKSRVPEAALPSPAVGVFTGSSRGASRTRDASRDRNPHGLQIQMVKTEEYDDQPLATASTTSKTHRSMRSTAASSRDGLSPLLTDGSTRSARGRNIDRYINSLEEANLEAEQLRAENRSRTRSRDGRAHSRARQRAGSTSKSEVAYIKPSKRSPSSPAAMHSDDYFKHPGGRDSYGRSEPSEVTSPVESRPERPRASSRGASRARASSKSARRPESPDDPDRLRAANKSAAARVSSRSRHRAQNSEQHDSSDDRGRAHERNESGGAPRSPSSPSPMNYGETKDDHSDETSSRRHRQRSTSRKADDRSRARSSSRRPPKFTLEEPWSATAERSSAEFPTGAARSPVDAIPRGLSRQERAQKDLEDRRLSLARRQPSVPPVPHPSEYNRPTFSTSRSHTADIVPTLSAATYNADPIRERSRTVEPEASRPKPNAPGMPNIGLPATPRAMRHPKYMSADPDEGDAVPEVPPLPESFQALPGAQEARLDGPGLLLPSSVYSQPPLPRSASAPPERANRARAGSVGRLHGRRPSEKDVLREDPAEDNVIVVEQTSQPMVLPELQHLAIPPPPPPPPPAPLQIGSTGFTNFPPEGQSDRVSPPNSAASPGSSSRRGRGSISGTASEGVGGIWKNMRDRIRSDSKSRAKSPPQAGAGAEMQSFTPSPYETKLPGQWSASGIGSPQMGRGEAVPPLPPLPSTLPGGTGQQMVQLDRGNLLAGGGKTSPPRMTAYRNPKEVREKFGNI